ncbi:Gfo/Idh/MocA family protein [Cohnella nanjingensis]|uniref:Gfo/Idh/MocA family oxidoreductase n=1 Tax=Cohnella nanjingensis TaxID=1387779 RepID=A0A7X0VEX4_9BACL|nr:Gfo/Idh/MocA family oxidoreductase [Cohnella nanjingensis]MBB6671216.1 Gfo/Idh/MocA family oxidoreductase [Cohnella nanjingensis]
MNDQTTPVRFGIVGCGIIAEVHAKCLLEMAGAKLTALFDPAADKANAFAEKFGGAVCGTYEELLAREDVDVVCICTPSGLHARQTVAAARAGKHVVVEKPMAIKLEDIDAMLAACAQSGVFLATIFPRRMSPQARYARQLIREGRLGRLSLCSGYVKLYRDQAYYDSAGWRGTWQMDGGGVMMNQGIHTVDLLQWLVGPVRSLYGQARAVLRDIEVEDTAVALLRYESGAMGTFEMTTTAYKGKGQRLEIHGEKGTMIIEEDDIVSLEIDGEQVVLPAFEPFRVVPDGHLAQLRDMAEAVRGRREPIVTGAEGRHSLEIILGVYASSRERREVEIGGRQTGIREEGVAG